MRKPKAETQRNKSLKDVSCCIPFCSEAYKGERSRNEHMKKKSKTARTEGTQTCFISVGNERRKKQKMKH